MANLIVLLACCIAIKHIVIEQEVTGEITLMQKLVMGTALIGVISALLGMVNILVKAENIPEPYTPNNLGMNDISSNVLSNDSVNTEYNQLVDNLFNFIDNDTGVVEFDTEQVIKEKLDLLCGIDIEEYNFNSVKRKKGVREHGRFYTYTVVSSGDKPVDTNSFGEWTVTQISNTESSSEVSNNNEPSQVKTVLHIGVDNNTSKSEAEIYLPCIKSKTYICLAEIQEDTGVIDLYPIFFSIEPNTYYVVKSNLYKLNIDNTDIKDIDDVLDVTTVNEQDTNLLEKNISSDINNVTLTITEITNTDIVGTIDNKNTFEIYIDNVAWMNKGNTVGENLLRVKAKTVQNFKLKYSGKIEVGDTITLEGEMKDVDAAFSSIGKVEFRFKIA